jgi:hypothetical protein
VGVSAVLTFGRIGERWFLGRVQEGHEFTRKSGWEWVAQKFSEPGLPNLSIALVVDQTLVDEIIEASVQDFAPLEPRYMLLNDLECSTYSPSDHMEVGRIHRVNAVLAGTKETVEQA